MCKQSAGKVYLFIIALCCPFFGISQDSTGIKYTLKQCVDSAIANNLQVRQSDLQMQTNEINWKQAKANMLPSLSAFADHGINEGRNIEGNDRLCAGTHSAVKLHPHGHRGQRARARKLMKATPAYPPGPPAASRCASRTTPPGRARCAPAHADPQAPRCQPRRLKHRR